MAEPGEQDQEHFLWLLRHARAGEPSGTGDRARPLTVEGAADATALGQLLAGTGVAQGRDRVPPPEVVLSSPAVRTRRTTECLFGGLGRQLPVSDDAALYGAGPDAIVPIVAGVDRSVHSVLVVGHNPGLYQTVLFLAGGAREEEVRSRLADGGFPPCSLAVLRVGGESWCDLVPAGAALRDPPATLVALLRPPY